MKRERRTLAQDIREALSFELNSEDLNGREWYLMVRDRRIVLVGRREAPDGTGRNEWRNVSTGRTVWRNAAGRLEPDDTPSEDLGDRAPDGRRWAEFMASPPPCETVFEPIPGAPQTEPESEKHAAAR